MPASEPSSAARGVIRRMTGADEAADHQHEALHEHPGEAGAPRLDRIAALEQDRQHDHEHHDEHVRHADPRGQRANVAAAGFLSQLAGEPGVIDRAEEQHQAGRGQDAPEDDRIGQLEHEAQQAGQHQHVDEDVGAEAEEGVPVARRPPGKRLVARYGHVRHRSHGRVHAACPPVVTCAGAAGAASAAITLSDSPTHPKIPPCATIMRSAISWNSGK